MCIFFVPQTVVSPTRLNCNDDVMGIGLPDYTKRIETNVKYLVFAVM